MNELCSIRQPTFLEGRLKNKKYLLRTVYVLSTIFVKLDCRIAVVKELIISLCAQTVCEAFP